MARGYCSKCGKLVPINAMGWAPNRTRQLWYPDFHRGADGKICGGVKLEAGNPPPTESN